MAPPSARPGIFPRVRAAPLAEGQTARRPWVGRLLAAGALGMALLRGGQARAADVDSWFGRDKALHFSLSAALSAGGYGMAATLTEDGRWRLLTGAVVGLAAGAGKEAHDATGAGDPSWRDFTWDVIGTATGLGLAYLLDWLITAGPACRARP